MMKDVATSALTADNRTLSRLPAIASSVLFLVCELISHPWAEMAICDDWSYVRSAQVLAQTGHIVYNGWATAMVGWQLYLAAIGIKLFGFSFTATRLGTFVVAALAVYLTHRTLTRLGLTSRNATIGTLTLTLSPLFMMLSATLMTDVPGYFALIVCLYGCVRALQEPSDRAAILWIAAAIAANVLCGTSRQIAWLGVLVLVPSTLWLLRSRRSVLIFGVALTFIGDLSVFAAMRWFAHQPFTLAAEGIGPSHLSLLLVKNLFSESLHTIVTMSLLLLPITLAFCWASQRLSRLTRLVLTVGVLVSVARYVLHPSAQMHFRPLLGDWVTVYANFGNNMLIGIPPIVIGHAASLILRTIGVFGTIIMLLLLWRNHGTAPDLRTPATFLTWKAISLLLAPIFVAYCFLLIRRAEGTIFDRYLLLPLFLFAYLLLRCYQEFFGDRLPLIAPLSLLLLAAFGITCTHNMFAFARARVELNHEFTAANIPQTAIYSGWEQDAWVELQHAPTISDARLTHPAGVYMPHSVPDIPNCHTEFLGLLPHIAPQYAVSFDPNACAGLEPSIAPVSYTNWPAGTKVTLYALKFPQTQQLEHPIAP